jgi:hypothetical protein
MIKSKHKLVLVKWQDAYNTTVNWKSIRELEKPKSMICFSVGWIIKQNKQNLLLMPHISDIKNRKSLGDGCGDIIIPKVSVLKIRRLR